MLLQSLLIPHFVYNVSKCDTQYIPPKESYSNKIQQRELRVFRNVTFSGSTLKRHLSATCCCNQSKYVNVPFQSTLIVELTIVYRRMMYDMLLF